MCATSSIVTDSRKAAPPERTAIKSNSSPATTWKERDSLLDDFISIHLFTTAVSASVGFVERIQDQALRGATPLLVGTSGDVHGASYRDGGSSPPVA